MVVVGLRQSKMRAMLKELRKNLGMPLERDVDDQDYGYRSTLSLRDLETRETRHHPDLSSEIDVPVEYTASRPLSVNYPSPPHPTQLRSSPPHPTRLPPSPPHGRSGAGRPPLPRHGRSRGDSHGTGSQDSVDPPDCSPQRINVLTIDSQFENTNYNSYGSEATANGLAEESDDGWDETDGCTVRELREPVTPTSVRSTADQTAGSSSARSRRREYRRDTNSRSTSRSSDQSHVDPRQRSLDARDGIPDASSPAGPDYQDELSVTRTVEMTRGAEDGAVRHGGSVVSFSCLVLSRPSPRVGCFMDFSVLCISNTNGERVHKSLSETDGCRPTAI